MSERPERPSSLLLGLITGSRITQAVYVAAKLGVADLLVAGPRTAQDLADLTGSHAPSLYRVLRALAGLGVVREDEAGRFHLTPVGEALRSDVPGSLKSMALFFGDPVWWSVMGDMLHVVQTGEPAFPHLYGDTMWEYLARHPEDEAVFNSAMTDQTERQIAAILDAYDFSGFHTVCDVGSGHGCLLASILQFYPAMHGIVFDQPAVIPQAAAVLQAAGVQERCRVVAGNMFKSIPVGADAYLAKLILHDWNDDEAQSLLHSFHASMAPGAVLLALEHIVEPGNKPQLAKLLDLSILVQLRGRERTVDEWRTLLESAGFGFRRTVPTRAHICVIEAVRS